jgi:CBS domain-containing protein
MTYIPSQLREIASKLKEGQPQSLNSLAELLHWYAVERRSPHVVRSVREGLAELGLTTEPEFESAFINGPVTFHLTAVDKAVARPPLATEAAQPKEANDAARLGSDPTFRIGRLESANQRPTSVAPNASIEQVITLMLEFDFSQIPVMLNERDVKGVITWKSIASALGLGCSADDLGRFMVPAVETERNRSLFSTIPAIIQNGYVLIRSHDKKICGIVTSTDLNNQFLQLAEPFLLLGEIENYVRRLIDQRLTGEEIRAARDPRDASRHVDTAADLTFGEYVRLIEVPSRWSSLNLKIDRQRFITRLQETRRIRNDVMHFDPDGIEPSDERKLREFAALLQTLAHYQVL